MEHRMQEGATQGSRSSSGAVSSCGRGQHRGSTVHTGMAQDWVSACQQVLHAVFFFGRLNRRQMTPDDFLEPSFSQRLQQKYPQSFQQYSTHLPSLPPYSILLQFVSTPHLHGANHGAGVGQVRDKCSTL